MSTKSQENEENLHVLFDLLIHAVWICLQSILMHNLLWRLMHKLLRCSLFPSLISFVSSHCPRTCFWEDSQQQNFFLWKEIDLSAQENHVVWSFTLLVKTQKIFASTLALNWFASDEWRSWPENEGARAIPSYCFCHAWIALAPDKQWRRRLTNQGQPFFLFLCKNWCILTQVSLHSGLELTSSLSMRCQKNSILKTVKTEIQNQLQGRYQETIIPQSDISKNATELGRLHNGKVKLNRHALKQRAVQRCKLVTIPVCLFLIGFLSGNFCPSSTSTASHVAGLNEWVREKMKRSSKRPEF